VLLAALAQRTGLDVAQLRAMTLGGWELWLLDALYVRRWDRQATFDAYVRDNSVLLAPGDAGSNDVSRWERWSGPWQPMRYLDRICPICTADPDRGSALVWRLPLMVGCVEHGCRLEEAKTVLPAVALGRINPVPVVEPVATVDRYTHQALTAGRVRLPGRSMHAGVWFRLLRSLLDEVSLALTTRSKHGRTTLERIWQATGKPPRAGLTTWQPYENLPSATQEILVQAAGTALYLAAGGQITARGVLGSALHPTVDQHVYDGDRPSPAKTAWQEALTSLEAAIIRARTDAVAARHLLTVLTHPCRTRNHFEQERAYLFGAGIPAEYLPTATELGRSDLR
jgi:hypothetical protein